MRVLHCNPASEEDQIWLPYAWGRFREYCDYRSEYNLSAINWLDPIYMGWFDVDKLISHIDWTEVHKHNTDHTNKHTYMKYAIMLQHMKVKL